MQHTYTRVRFTQREIQRSRMRAAFVGIAAAMLLFASLGTVAFAEPGRNAEPQGNNGTLKIHDAATGQEDRRNEPKVCRFYLAGFNFDANSKGSWRIDGHGGNAGSGDASGSFSANADGFWRTSGSMTLPEGQYKAFAKQDGTPGGDKQKVFKVECGAAPAGPGPGPGAPGAPGAPTQPGAQQPGQPAVGEQPVTIGALPSTSTAGAGGSPSALLAIGGLLAGLSGILLSRIKAKK
jgi:hypothetical protein